jgi:hypothetical protein
LLGRLHTRSGEALPPGGAWHHLALEGTPADEMAVARTLLTDLRSNATRPIAPDSRRWTRR